MIKSLFELLQDESTNFALTSFAMKIAINSEKFKDLPEELKNKYEDHVLERDSFIDNQIKFMDELMLYMKDDQKTEK